MYIMISHLGMRVVIYFGIILPGVAQNVCKYHAQFQLVSENVAPSLNEETTSSKLELPHFNERAYQRMGISFDAG